MTPEEIESWLEWFDTIDPSQMEYKSFERFRDKRIELLHIRKQNELKHLGGHNE